MDYLPLDKPEIALKAMHCYSKSLLFALKVCLLANSLIEPVISQKVLPAEENQHCGAIENE